jgi:hypothetical protein
MRIVDCRLLIVDLSKYSDDSATVQSEGGGDTRQIPSASLRAGSSLRLKNGCAQMTPHLWECRPTDDAEHRGLSINNQNSTINNF